MGAKAVIHPKAEFSQNVAAMLEMLPKMLPKPKKTEEQFAKAKLRAEMDARRKPSKAQIEKFNTVLEKNAQAAVSRDATDPTTEFQKAWGRRLVGCGLSNDHDAPHGLFILAPILMILMMVFFMYRKPIQNSFSGSRSAKPSYGGLRNIRKKAPVVHVL